MKYYFAHDLLNYARLIPVHIAQMRTLESEDPHTWDALKSGNFVVAKTQIPSSRLCTDQALEQEIKTLKAQGGMVGLSQNEACLDRLLTTSPHLARMVQQYFDTFLHKATSTPKPEHHQLTGNISVRIRNNAIKIRGSIEQHCEGNPFTIECPLKSLGSSRLVPEKAADDILHFAEKGQARLEDFVTERLLQESRLSV